MKKLLLSLLLLQACALIPKQVTVDVKFLPKQQVSPSNIKGLDVLGLAKQRADIIRDEIDPNTAVGVLDVSFGDPYPKLTTVISSNKVSAIRMHLGDGTLSTHQCTPALHDLTTLRNRAVKYQAFCDKNPGIKCYVSPWLEHGCTDQTLVRNWYVTLRKYAPRMSGYVCSTYRGYCPSDTLKEVHGSPSNGAVYSPDGVSGYDLNSTVFVDSGKVISFNWTQCDNLRTTGETGFVSIPQRVDYCTRGDYQQKVRMMRALENHPTIAGCKEFKTPELLKTNAEYYGKGKDDGRGNKTLLILKNKYPRISIQTLKGKEVGYLTYYGTYSGGGYRYYIGSKYGSNQTPVQLMDLLGGEWGLAKSGQQCWYFSPIRRQGYFQK